LDHPGVIPIYGFGHDSQGKPFYAMRYLRGERTFEDEISDTHQIVDTSARSVAFRKLLRDFATVCRTIDYAHSKELIHRDIKPNNIMTGDYGEVLVVDWGLAKSLENDNRDDIADNALETEASASRALLTLGVAGTLSYMSPEQADQTSLATKASDIYSLGATLYHLLTGRPAYEGESISEVLARVRSGVFEHPRTVRADVPAALDAICVKAMSYAPADRYPNASAIANDIDRWLADESVSVWPDPVLERIRRWTKRNRTLATSIAAGLLVAVLTLSVASLFLDAARRREQAANDALVAANQTLAGQNVELRRPQYAAQFQVARSLWQTLEFDEATRVLASMDQDL
ncbi:MAG: serine/threonine protein kinase, partial [Planctomycetales bacterium]|nr:serine/threonine protein kinase [Planctomycetales bacterium]